MTCSNCIHYRVCENAYCWIDPNNSNEYITCYRFKPKSRFIELPCAVGEPIYQIVYCRCGNPQYYEAKQCMKRTTKSTPKCYGQVMSLQMGRKVFWDDFYGHKYQYIPKGTICHKIYQRPFALKMIDEVGKTVFVTLEEAEKALERSEGK